MQEIFRDNRPVFVYWGKRGGGLDLLVDTLKEISSFRATPIDISVRKENFAYIEQETDAPLKNYPPKGIPSGSYAITKLILEPLFSHLRVIMFRKEFPKRIAFVIMSSPWDKYLISTKGLTVIRVVHDSQSHPGDSWPKSRTIAKWVRGCKFVTLSKYVDLDIKEKYGNNSLACLTLRKNSGLNFVKIKVPQNYILICGRLKEYKNLSQTIQFLRRSTDLPIIVAGELKSTIADPTGQIIFLERWLDPGELEYLIAHARLLVCYYSEASQSGILETGIYYGTPMLASDVGALPEQLKNIENALIIPLDNSESFIAGTKALLEMKKSKKISRGDTNRKNLADFILENFSFS
jgi:glycosyltransferase involved in cell wall biosynthesis